MAIDPQDKDVRWRCPDCNLEEVAHMQWGHCPQQMCPMRAEIQKLKMDVYKRAAESFTTVPGTEPDR